MLSLQKIIFLIYLVLLTINTQNSNDKIEPETQDINFK
jgi:hypothetical protein